MGKTETTEEKNATVRKPILKKVSADQIKLSDKPTGFTLKGVYVGITARERVDGEGEISTLHTMVIEDHKTKIRTKFLADAGLRTALEDSMVQKGDYFEAVKGEKMDIGKGRTMNTWDIFQYANEN